MRRTSNSQFLRTDSNQKVLFQSRQNKQRISSHWSTHKIKQKFKAISKVPESSRHSRNRNINPRCKPNIACRRCYTPFKIILNTLSASPFTALSNDTNPSPLSSKLNKLHPFKFSRVGKNRAKFLAQPFSTTYMLYSIQDPNWTRNNISIIGNMSYHTSFDLLDLCFGILQSGTGFCDVPRQKEWMESSWYILKNSLGETYFRNTIFSFCPNWNNKKEFA